MSHTQLLRGEQAHYNEVAHDILRGVRSALGCQMGEEVAAAHLAMTRIAAKDRQIAQLLKANDGLGSESRAWCAVAMLFLFCILALITTAWSAAK